uniref:Uncharacterized protein n=1 Tax=Arundo donax TaxID=35708 RepID=A0A0A9HMJ5_ARUDO
MIRRLLQTNRCVSLPAWSVLCSCSGCMSLHKPHLQPGHTSISLLL